MLISKKSMGFIVCVGMVFLSLTPTYAKENGKRLVLNLIGEGTSVEMFVPDPENNGQPVTALCYEVDLFNAKNRQLIGTATDCLSNFAMVGGGVALVGTTTFRLPQGTIVTQGRTTVQPVVQPTTTTDGQTITHTTGASAAGNSILEGTKRFRNATGTVRLSGLVDLTDFKEAAGDSIFFDCLFVMDLD
jgi:hypothetical protein